MDVELKHHYGWKVHRTDADNLDDAAKQAIRDTHDFLTDTNHTMEAGERELTWGGSTSKYNYVHVMRGEGAPEYSGPRGMETDYWFAVEYRAVQNEAIRRAAAGEGDANQGDSNGRSD